MITRLFALASAAAIAWLLVDESNYRLLRRWIRTRTGDSASTRIERRREQAAETADELRAAAP